jgi:hypothetical protein
MVETVVFRIIPRLNDSRTSFPKKFRNVRFDTKRAGSGSLSRLFMHKNEKILYTSCSFSTSCYNLSHNSLPGILGELFCQGYKFAGDIAEKPD